MRLVIGTALALGMAVWMPNARAASDQTPSDTDQSQQGDTSQVQTQQGQTQQGSEVIHRKTTTTEETDVQPADKPPPAPETGQEPGTVENPNPPEQGGFGPGTETTTPSGEVATPPPETTTEAPYMPPTAVRAERAHGPGYSITVGGGPFGYSDSDARAATTKVGGMYTARLGIGTRSLVALEVAYLGTAQNINALGVSPNAVLLSNGVEGVLRLNGGSGMIQPFILGGAAWRHFSVSNTSYNTSSLNSSDSMVDFPVGAGLALRVSSLILDARGEYRFTTSDNLLRQELAGSKLNSWMAFLNAGVEF